MDNYRGIFIVPVLLKTLELICLEEGASDEFNADGSELQFGFTKGCTPTMATLLLTESIAESRINHLPLFIASLDARKAFDVVNHSKLKTKVFFSSLRRPLWSIIDDLYTDCKECIRWGGTDGEEYSVLQGVRQGGILSTHLYKCYINDLLKSLEKAGLGMRIGPVYVGSPTCADDVMFLSNIGPELQGMLNFTAPYASEHYYEIHPTKSVISELIRKRTVFDEPFESFRWDLGGQEITKVDSFTHLGLEWKRGDPSPNIDKHIASARATAYAMLGVGLHGHGLDASASFKLIRAYIIPRLLYGLEACVLTRTKIEKLEMFYRKLLRQIQNLPQSTAREAVYLLLGTIPLEAQLHLRVLSLFGAITRLDQ